MTSLRLAPFLLVVLAACGAKSPPDLQAFADCAAMGKVDEVVAGLAAHPEWAKASTASGRTALHAAALVGRVEVADKLLAAGADLTAVETESQATLLHIAAEQGRDEFVDWLLGKKVPLEAKDQNGRTPLHLACWSSDANGYVVRQLLTAGAAIEATDSGNATALLMAAIRGHTELARLLLDRGAKVDVTAEDGRTPLSAARDGGHEATAKLLEAAGAK